MAAFDYAYFKCILCDERVRAYCADKPEGEEGKRPPRLSDLTDHMIEEHQEVVIRFLAEYIQSEEHPLAAIFTEAEKRRAG